MELPVDNNDIALFNAATSVVLGTRLSSCSFRWLDGQAPATLYSALFKHSKRKNRTVSDALADDKWIRDIDYSMTERVVEKFIALWTCLQGITVQLTHEDKITWLHTTDGQYTARSAYRIQFLGMASSMTAKITWKTKAPPKC